MFTRFRLGPIRNSDRRGPGISGQRALQDGGQGRQFRQSSVPD